MAGVSEMKTRSALDALEDLERAGSPESPDTLEDRSTWRESKRGNLWRLWRGWTLTIFKKAGEDTYRWCVADEDGPRFSRKKYKSERRALAGLRKELERREGE